MKNKLTFSKIREAPRECLESALKRLQIVINAQPTEADEKFFRALAAYTRMMGLITRENLLPQNDIIKYNEAYRTYSLG